MNQPLVKILMLGLLLLFLVAPFAGFAPLMLLLLVTGTASVAWSLLRVLFVGEKDQEEANS